MNKKQLMLLVTSLVLSAQAMANKDATNDEPQMTEDEARVLVGQTLKRKAKALVSETCHAELEDVIWVNAPEKAKKGKDDAPAS